VVVIIVMIIGLATAGTGISITKGNYVFTKIYSSEKCAEDVEFEAVGTDKVGGFQNGYECL
jgi:hypothetical protein